MGNLTLEEKLVVGHEGLDSLPGYTVVVFEKLDKGGAAFSQVINPGGRFQKSGFRFWDRSNKYFSVAVNNSVLSYSFEERVTLDDEIHTFTLKFQLKYRAVSPRMVAELRDQDPLGKLREEVALVVGRSCARLKWEMVTNRFRELEVVVMNSERANLRQYAAALGLEIFSVTLDKRLPSEVTTLPKAEEMAEKEKREFGIAQELEATKEEVKRTREYQRRLEAIENQYLVGNRELAEQYELKDMEDAAHRAELARKLREVQDEAIGTALKNVVGGISTLSELLKGAQVARQTTGGILVEGLTKNDEVQCTVFSPLKVSPGDSFLVQVFAHLATQVLQVVSMARAADADAKQRDSVELDKPIERGQELVFELTMRGLEVQEPTTTRLVWKGKPKSVKFDVQVPEDCQPKSVTGTVDIYYLNVPIGNLRFKLDIVPRGGVGSAVERPSFPEQKFKLYRYAFISYASEDRAEVLRRVQVLPLVRIGYFQDITSLDPGDRWANELYKEIDKSDVFFLFWSKAARRSEWVEREVLYAIERKHGDEDAAPDIKPVMLEGPPPVEPPDSLRSLHFNDKMLYFISVEDSLRAARMRETSHGEGEKSA